MATFKGHPSVDQRGAEIWNNVSTPLPVVCSLLESSLGLGFVLWHGMFFDFPLEVKPYVRSQAGKLGLTILSRAGSSQEVTMVQKAHWTEPLDESCSFIGRDGVLRVSQLPV